ncbi:MAG: hypothetical protein V1837_03370 [Candidatus Woesearchaeota archaeon]
MHLQKHISRKYGNKEYAKWVIVLKTEHIEQLVWKEGDELKAEVKGNKLLIEKNKSSDKEHNISEK